MLPDWERLDEGLEAKHDRLARKGPWKMRESKKPFERWPSTSRKREFAKQPSEMQPLN